MTCCTSQSVLEEQTGCTAEQFERAGKALSQSKTKTWFKKKSCENGKRLQLNSLGKAHTYAQVILVFSTHSLPYHLDSIF